MLPRIVTFLAAVVSVSSGFWFATPARGEDILLRPGQPMVIATMGTPGFGIDTSNAVELAVEQFGGSILGHTVRTRHFRFGCYTNPGLQDEFINGLSNDPKIVGIIGPICSFAAFQRNLFLSEAQILTISPANTVSVLTDPAFHDLTPYYYRTAPNDLFQGDFAGSFARTSIDMGGLGAGSAAIVFYGNDDFPFYSTNLATGFAETFGSENIAGAFQVEFGQEDFTALLAEIANLDTDPDLEGIQNVDVIYAPLFDELIPLFLQLRALNHPINAVPFIAPDSLAGEFIFEFLGGPDPTNLYITNVNAQGPNFETFFQDYVARYGHEPSYFDSLVYDATRLMLRALDAKAQLSAKGGLVIAPPDLLTFMNDAANYPGEGYEGAGGVYTTPVNGDLNPNGWAMFKAEGGQFTPIFP